MLFDAAIIKTCSCKISALQIQTDLDKFLTIFQVNF
jgi:hypothetical protein